MSKKETAQKTEEVHIGIKVDAQLKADIIAIGEFNDRDLTGEVKQALRKHRDDNANILKKSKK